MAAVVAEPPRVCLHAQRRHHRLAILSAKRTTRPAQTCLPTSWLHPSLRGSPAHRSCRAESCWRAGTIYRLLDTEADPRDARRRRVRRLRSPPDSCLGRSCRPVRLPRLKRTHYPLVSDNRPYVARARCPRADLVCGIAMPEKGADRRDYLNNSHHVVTQPGAKGEAPAGRRMSPPPRLGGRPSLSLQPAEGEDHGSVIGLRRAVGPATLSSPEHPVFVVKVRGSVY
jgi:hypothetical protein